MKKILTQDNMERQQIKHCTFLVAGKKHLFENSDCQKMDPIVREYLEKSGIKFLIMAPSEGMLNKEKKGVDVRLPDGKTEMALSFFSLPRIVMSYHTLRE